jgi:exoribonuclease R
MAYKILFDTPNYDQYVVLDSHSDKKQDIELNPRNNTLFNFDVFDYCKDTEKVTIRHSTTRNFKQISGILTLSSKTIFGRDGKKILYKCIPDDKRLPAFIIPYKIKQDRHSLSSNYSVDKYITFRFLEWNNGEKYPKGQLVETIGDVTKLENYYEYQLYCNSLYTSIKNFNQATIKQLHNTKIEDITARIDQMYPTIEDRTQMKVFSIDPSVSKDFDDAVGIHTNELGEKVISIYITNVVLWMNVLDLWSSFSKRVSTIYLPDRKRPMLPTILSDNICSLKENEIRYALTMEVTIDNSNTIKSHRLLNTKVNVFKNYRYEESSLLEDPDYIDMFRVVKGVNCVKEQRYLDNVADSHDLVSYLMILMNYYSSKNLMEHKNGIFRSLKYGENKQTVPEGLNKNVSKFLRIWTSNGSKYILFDEEDKKHDMFNFGEYIHITSPIRRLVDLLNSIQIQDNLDLCSLSGETEKFLNYWTSNDSLTYINETMRSIRKVQNNCNTLHRCLNDENILGKEYNGCIIDKMERNNGIYQYIVYVVDLNIVSKFMSIQEYDLYTEGVYKLFYFEDKDSLKKKVRLQKC